MKKFYSLILLAAALICLPRSAKAAQTILEEGFENDDFATKWTLQSADSGTKRSNGGSYSTHSGEWYFKFNYNANPPQYLISQELSVPGNATSLSLSLYYKPNSASWTETFQIGYSTTTNDVSTAFTWDSEISTSDATWKEYTNASLPLGTKYIAIKYNSNDMYGLYIDDIKITCNVSGPSLSVFDGDASIATGYSYNFGLATEGTTKVFTLKNDGTEPTPVSVAHTGNYGVELSATSIPVGGEVSLTVTMPDATSDDVITISSTEPSIADFAINVSGTLRDGSKLFETLLDGSIPEEWTTTGTWSWSATNGASNTAYYESSNYRLITPLLTVAAGENFFFDARGTYTNYQGVVLEYSADGETWTKSSVTTTLSSDWQTFLVNDIPAGKYYIALHGWQVNIRNFYGGSVPAIPKNVTVTGIALDGATINWTAFNNETAWQVSYSTTSGDPDNGTLVSADSESKVLSGLTTGTTYYVSVRIDNGGGDYGEWSNEVSFTPECSAPTALTLGEVTDKTATISWTAAAGISQYQYIYVAAGADTTGLWATALSTNELSVPLTGLTANTSYDFYVRSFHNAEIQSTPAKLNFRTECGVVAIGWSESFDSSFPTCWSKANYYMWSSSYQWAPSTNEKKSGSYSILLRSYKYNNNAYSDLETPSIAISEKAALAFYRLCTAEVPLTVLMKVNGVETQLATYSTAQSSWTATPTTINIPDTCVGKTISIIFRGNGAGSTYNRYLYLDDISINYQPAEMPTNLTAAPTADGAVITWNNDEEGPWDLRYKEAEASEWTEVNGLTQKTYTLTGLSAEKSYDVQVRANCSANRQSAWTSSITFAPTCPTPSTIEFSNQTYNGATVTWVAGGGESAWNLRYKNADDADWTVVNNLTTRTQNLVNLTTGKEYTVEVQASCNGEWTSATYTPAFVAPTFASEEITDVTATISWNDVDGAKSYKYAFVPKDDAVDWSSATQTGNAYAEISGLQALTEYDFYVKTMYTSGESEGAHKTFTTIAIAPNNLTLDEVKATSATFSWEKNGSAARQYQVAVAEGSASADWANATLTENDVLTATIDNLQPNTSYTFYVRAYYDAEKVSAAVSEPFETPCAAIASFPWEENFESVSVETIPACWDKSASTATPDWDDESYIWTVYLHNAGGNNLLRLNNSMVNANGVAVINTPIFEIPASPAYDLTFSYAHTASCGEFAVLVSVDGGAFSNFAEPKSYGKTSESTSTSDPGELTNAVISLADYAGRTVAFQFSATPDNTNGAIFIDNVKVAEHVNEETAIGNTGSETKTVKAIENGQLIIIREGVKYNAQGKQL